ncbi:MAG: penicillin-binding transpeptidase domain-containing protein [Colwellia sp.]|nr:penicillin-binding transpeptidase domain-containing protein [Colwellia sp.]MCW8865126.1 penicillin-binding transpeptidase domain-containing protein [Colwellia sp.]MCW9081973.1 penicillin-binding transpeptidase domain-containing protein [Colwellia sp.]
MKVIKLLMATVFLGYYSNFALASDESEFCQKGSDSCTFVLLSEYKQADGTFNNKLSSVNEHRAKTPLSPFSTFKVVNSLIGLDLGIIKDTMQTLTYDKQAYPVQAWWPPVWKLPRYDLTTAFKYSMVAIYRQLAKDIGEKNMLSYLQKMHYGNEDISSGLDNFWLNGSMKISAIEQTLLLQKIYHNQFAVHEKAIANLKTVMLAETTEDYRLFAKTGAGKVDNGSMLGWYIGFVENVEGVHFFAFNFDSPSYGEMKAKRINVAKNHLKRAGVLK